jgi:ketosteroid isomerase-like protein
VAGTVVSGPTSPAFPKPARFRTGETSSAGTKITEWEWRPIAERGGRGSQMINSPTAIVEAAFQCYRARDRAAAFALYADDFSFTSPQDDHIDKATFFERCFPTAGRLKEQRLLHVTPADADIVFVYYEYELTTGDRYRNVEAITVRDGLIREVQVFFGGKV